MGVMENIVISGVGGWFPKCKNIEEFKTVLLNQNDLFDTRWKAGEFNVSNIIGKIPAVDLFDSSFFGVHRKQAMFMDPMHRMILERTFEAIIDAGINPNDIRGKNIAVFTSSTISENDYLIFQVIINGFGVTGQSRTMLSNRISYWLNLKGPSCSYDNLYNNGILVLQAAYDAIKSGLCEAAIIGSTNLVINPHISYLFNQMGMLSPDGVTRCFDAYANGYVRSEAIISLYVQKESDAKRIYANIEHVLHTHFGDQDTFYTDIPDKSIHKFLHDFYRKSKINTDEIEFLEAYGSAILSLDKKELDAIDAIFNRTPDNPLLIGSVKSIAGHSEASSSLMSVVKILIAMETKMIPPNISYNTPNPNIESLTKNKLKVVLNNTKWNGKLAAVNCIGITAGFGHVVLKSESNDKELKHDNLPRLILLSSRTEEGIEKIIETIHKQPNIDYEYIRLIHDVFSSNITGHLYRAYTIVDSKFEIKKESEFYSNRKRPLWFVYSGMGSQWNMMGKDLMQLPIFANAIEKCHKVLKSKGIDLKKILTENEPEMFDNILNSFVGIAAVQIGLTDVLKALKLEPDGIIGHSVGELGCAYADGCMTAEQMILSAYSRGKASVETELIQGMMAAVGLGYDQIKNKIPESIEVACHNGPDSCTISGPAADIDSFVIELKSKGIFAKLVNVSNIAYHSRYIKPAAPKLLQYLKEVLPEPIKRSSKWISTSIPEANWDSELSQTSSAEYHTNNLLSSVLFEEGIKHIPVDSVVIEIAPHGLLQAILKRSLHQTCSNITLTHRTAQNGFEYFLSALGKTYLNGIDMNVSYIYPEIKFPVSRGTASLAPLVHWEHSESWHTGIGVIKNYQPGELEIQVSLNRKEFRDLIDFKLEQKIVFPSAAYMAIVWQVFKLFKGILNTNITVFEDLKFFNHFQVPFKGSIPIYVMVHKGSGNFEFCQGNSLLVSGTIKIPESKDNPIDLCDFIKDSNDVFVLNLNSDVIYKEFNYRGYEYSGIFKSIKDLKLSEKYIEANVKYQNSWLALIELMLQLVMFKNGEKSQNILMPYFIQRLVLSLNDLPNENEDIKVIYNLSTGFVTTKCLQISGIKLDHFNFENEFQFRLESSRFISFTSTFNNEVDILNVSIQIILNNLKDNSSLSIVEHFIDNSLLSLIQLVCNNFNFLQINLKSLPKNKKIIPISNQTTALVIGEYDTLNECITLIGSSLSFFLLKIKVDQILKIDESFITIAEFVLKSSSLPSSNNYKFILLRKSFENSFHILNIESNNFISCKHIQDTKLSWVSKLKSTIASLNSNKFQKRLILIFKSIPIEGTEKFSNELRKNFNYDDIKFIFLTSNLCSDFSISNSILYQKVIKQNIMLSLIRGNDNGNYYKYFEEKSIPFYYSNKLTTFTNSNLSTLKFNYSYIGVNQDSNIYLEYSGYNKENKAVLGLINKDFTPDSILVWNVPEIWSMEDAATTPLAYLMGYYCLYELIQMRKGIFALIHNGCYPENQALIDILAAEGAIVYTTVFNENEFHYAKQRFRNIPEKNIIRYGNEVFKTYLLNETSGIGFDLITSNLPRKYIQTSLCLLAFGGKFIQLPSLKDHKKDYSVIGLKIFLKSTEVYGVKYDQLYNAKEKTKQKLFQLFQNGIDKAVVKPLKRTMYKNRNIQHVIREHDLNKISKTIINIENKDDLLKNINSKIGDQYECDNKASYIVFGDSIIDDFFHMIEWLIFHGAKNIILCYSEFPNNYSERIISTFKKHYDCSIHIFINTIKHYNEAVDILKKSNIIGELRFIILINVSDVDFIVNINLASRYISSNPIMILLQCNADGISEIRQEDNLITYNLSSERQRSFNFFNDILLILNDILVVKNTDKIIIKKNFENQFEESQQMKINDLKLLLPNTAHELFDFMENITNDLEIIPLPSLSPQRIREIPPIFIVSSLFDTNREYLLKLCEKLLHPIYLISLPKYLNHSICNMAEIIAKKLLKFYTGPFNFIGVSYGGILTLEIVQKIEEYHENAKIKVFFLDSAPKTIQNIIKYLEKKQLKPDVSFLTFLLNIDNMDIISELNNANNFEKRLEIAMRNIDETNFNIDLSKESTLKSLMEGFRILWNRIEKILEYQVSFDKQINAIMHLLRPKSCNLDDDCGLCAYSKQTVKIDLLNGNHRTILLDKQLPHIINDSILTFELQDIY